MGTIAIEKSEKLNNTLRKSGFLPTRLQELLKAAGLEGPKLEKWTAQLADRHREAMYWLIRAGVTASEVKNPVRRKV